MNKFYARDVIPSTYKNNSNAKLKGNIIFISKDSNIGITKQELLEKLNNYVSYIGSTINNK